ncbi:MAG: CoA-binding protein [Deltaproteobacteria bacterium]|nr:CoA-binding protein [Deltaproteobacteria bacterium]
MADRICNLLQRYRTVAVVGLSPKPERDSHRVARYLQEQGFRIIPVNPGQRKILGEICYPSLSSIPEPLEIVDVFRRSDAILPIAEEAVQSGARVFWMQLGIRNDEAMKRLNEAGVEVVMGRCIKIEYMRCRQGKRPGEEDSC